MSHDTRFMMGGLGGGGQGGFVSLPLTAKNRGFLRLLVKILTHFTIDAMIQIPIIF